MGFAMSYKNEPGAEHDALTGESSKFVTFHNPANPLCRLEHPVGDRSALRTRLFLAAILSAIHYGSEALEY
jgi:hypothetical protein